MGIQVVFNHDALFGIWKIAIDQIMHAPGPILLGTTFSDLDMPPIQQGCKEHEQVGSSLAAIFIIVTCWWACLHRKGLARFTDHLNRGLIKANLGPFWNDYEYCRQGTANLFMFFAP